MTPQLPDALVDELDSSMQYLGRLFIVRHNAEAHAGNDVSGPRFLALRALSDEPRRVSDVAGLLGVKAPAASAMVDHLEAEGMVERTQDPDDRRATLVRLTEDGRARLTAAEHQRRELMRRYCAVLPEEDVRSLIRIHNKLIDAMTNDRV